MPPGMRLRLVWRGASIFYGLRKPRTVHFSCVGCASDVGAAPRRESDRANIAGGGFNRSQCCYSSDLDYPTLGILIC